MTYASLVVWGAAQEGGAAITLVASLGGVRQAEPRQRDSRDTDAELFQCPASGDGLGHVLGQFIEFVVHSFPFVFGFFLTADYADYADKADRTCSGFSLSVPIRAIRGSILLIVRSFHSKARCHGLAG